MDIEALLVSKWFARCRLCLTNKAGWQYSTVRLC